MPSADQAGVRAAAGEPQDPRWPIPRTMSAPPAPRRAEYAPMRPVHGRRRSPAQDIQPHKTGLHQRPRARDDRPGLAALIEYVREADTVVVWKLDRLGHNTLHILETVKELTDRGIALVSITDGIDSSTPAGRKMIGVLGSLAEYERELIKERTALKRNSSRANGTRFGRPKKVADATHIATARRMKIDGHIARDVANYLGVSRATLYRYLTAETG
jgi:DNA invertase Pin-like site-specific DNA recombinase